MHPRRSYPIDSLDQQEKQREDGDPDRDGGNVHEPTMDPRTSQPHDDRAGAHNDFVTAQSEKRYPTPGSVTM
jgi:hypothetical protein